WVNDRARTFMHGSSSLFTNDRSSTIETVGLDPLRRVAMTASNTSFTFDHSFDWNWDTFSGTLELGVDYCQGKRPPGGTPVETDVPPIDMSVIAIPLVTLPAEFLGGDFRTVGLGDCAARIDGASSGFTIYGDPGTSADALLRVVVSRSKELFVEIDDDRFVAGN